MLENFKNYQMFTELVQTGKMTIHTKDITMYSWDLYYNGILAIMQDGIETDLVKKSKITIIFDSVNESCVLTVPDLYFNIIMWHMIIRANMDLTPKHLFFEDAITQKTIKDFIDDNYILEVRETLPIKEMNNTIDDSMYKFMDVDIFSMYIANTINLEDFIALSKASPRFNELMHVDFSNIPIEDIKDMGMGYTKEMQDIILNSKSIMGFEHCLVDSFRSKQGINPKQFKEFAVNIGTKPDGKGGAYPSNINASYLNGGLNNALYMFMDCGASRIAQIITKNHVGDSGDFGRVLGLNSIDSIFHNDPDYDCRTKNFLSITLSSKAIFDRYIDRYYRFHPDGVEYVLTKKDTHLIGQTLLFRSPETCASAARGDGICFKCYGKLAYSNRNIKPGKIAAELDSSVMTQERLSAKHYLETQIIKHSWNEAFFKYMEVNMNGIMLSENIRCNENAYILIDPNDIHLLNEDDYDKTDYIDEEEAPKSKKSKEEYEVDDINDSVYNEFITKFIICDGENQEVVSSEDGSIEMYISISLNLIIRNSAIPENDMIRININDIEDSVMFFIKVKNDEFGKSLNDMNNLINKKDITKTHTIHSLTQSLIQTAIDGGIDIMAVHFEVLIMNQIRAIDSHLRKPNFAVPNAKYEILTLRQSLEDNPSVTVSLLYRDLHKQLYRPITYKKTQSSFIDLFFAKKPQTLLSDKNNIIDTTKKPQRISPVSRIHRK